MILLRDLMAEAGGYPPKDKNTTWRTPLGFYGAKNDRGDIRYFSTREHALKFSQGKIYGHREGHPEEKEHKEHAEPIERYS